MAVGQSVGPARPAEAIVFGDALAELAEDVRVKEAGLSGGPCIVRNRN